MKNHSYTLERVKLLCYTVTAMSDHNNHQKPQKDTHIKTSLELALEKLQQEPLTEDTPVDEYFRDEGKKLAAAFMRGDKINLKDQLKKQDKKNRSAVLGGLKEILLMNLVLPHNDKVRKECRRALEGIVIILNSSPEILAICGEIENLLDQYLTQTHDYHRQLVEHFKEQADMIQEQVQAQYGRGMEVNPEHLPEFQKKWHEIKGQLDEQYTAAFYELKDRLASQEYPA